MRIAVVDIGTNSTRLLVAQVDGQDHVTELDRRATVTRLGEGVERTGALSDQAMKRVFATLEGYAAAIADHGVERTVGVLTSAVRDASNGPAFTAAVSERFGIEARTIAGEHEARLTYLGATSERADDGAPVLVIDIGGGSTELVVGHAQRLDFFVSTQAGVVRHGERHITTDPPPRGELDALAADVREVFAGSVPAAVCRAVTCAIGVAGTATSLAAIDLRLEPYDPEAVHGHRLGLGTIESLRDRLAALPEAERRQVPGLHPDRAPTIVAGTVLLIEALTLFGLDEVEVSEHDILRGAALEAAR